MMTLTKKRNDIRKETWYQHMGADSRPLLRIVLATTSGRAEVVDPERVPCNSLVDVLLD
jgi:hypothetical protein